MTKPFIRFDEIEDILSSLDLLALVVTRLDEEPSYWKWAIIATHSALQGAMVCALQDTVGVAVLTDGSAHKTLNWLETGEGAPPKEKLAHFDTLLERCRKTECMDDEPLKISETDVQDIISLHDHFRNNFSHFVPKGWSIERACLPRILLAALYATELLLLHRRISYKLTGNKQRRICARMQVIREHLKS